MRKLIAVLVLVTLCVALPWTSRPVEASPGAGLRIVDASDPTKTTPVVNEGGKLQLKVVDGAGNPVTVSAWSSDNKLVAKVNKKKGLLKGRTYGFATVMAQTALGSAVGFVVVARVRRQTGASAQGDTKTDANGNVYLSSPTRHVLYRATGLSAEVFAGAVDQGGFVDGTGGAARFDEPSGLGVDNRADGGLYVADTMNDCIRKVDFRGRTSFVVGTPEVPGTMTADETPIAEAVMAGPQGVATVGSNLFVTDTENHCIWYVDVQRQVVELFAGEPGQSGLANGQGRAARFNRPTSITINSSQNLLAVADTANNVVRLIAITPRPGGGVIGNVTTLGPASSARSASILDRLGDDRGQDQLTFDAPQSVAFDGVDNVYVVDSRSASVVTRPPPGNGRAVERVDLAQTGTLGAPASVTVRQSQAFVLDGAAASDATAVQVVDVASPTILSVSPPMDRVEGGAQVVITGTNFAPESKVTLGNIEVPDYTVMSSTRITFVVPPQNTPGSRKLAVATRGGTAQVAFSIVSPPLDDLSDGEITTIAGGVADTGDGGAASTGRFDAPDSIAVDSAGNVTIADTDANRIRRIDALRSTVTTIAGNGSRGSGGDGGPASDALLAFPHGVAVDGAGNLFVADSGNGRVRRIEAATGTMTTVAGGSPAKRSRTDKTAGGADLHRPFGLAVDRDGNLFVADDDGGRVVRIDSETGAIVTVAGTGAAGYNGDGRLATSAELNRPKGVAVDSDGDIYIADGNNNRVRRVDAVTRMITTVAGTGAPGFGGDGGPAATALLSGPSGVAVDGAGDVLVADTDNHRIRRIDRGTGLIATVAGVGDAGFGGDGGAATAAKLLEPDFVAVDALGNLFVADTGNNRIRRIDSVTGAITTIAGGAVAVGDGGPATAAGLNDPRRVLFDADGDLLIADTRNNRVRRVDAVTGTISTVAGTGDAGFGGDGGPASRAMLDTPSGIAVDDAGDLFISDSENRRIRRVDEATGEITTIAGNGSDGDSGDGGPATGAELRAPSDVALDSAGNLFIADDSRVRRVDHATGTITTVAGTGLTGFGGDGGPAMSAMLAMGRSGGIDVDDAGNLFIADAFNNRIRRVDAVTKTITTIAGTGVAGSGGDGGPATSATLNQPADVAVDGAGNVFAADTQNHRVRQIDAVTKRIATVGGNGVSGYDGDGGAAILARTTLPEGVAVDAAGSLVIADTGNNSIRAVRGVAVPRERRLTIAAQRLGVHSESAL